MQQLPPGFRLDQPAPSPNRAPGVIRGAPKTASPVEQERLNIARQAEARAAAKDAREQEEAAREQAEAAEAAKRADQMARAKLLNFIGRASKIAIDADDAGGWFETGTTGALMRNLPGSNAAKDLVADTKTLRANLAFDALQAMRDASKTGGALGQVSEIELQLLESAVANVNPEGQTHENFLKNLEFARQAYLDKLNAIDPQMAKRLGYDPKEAEAAWIDMVDQYGEVFGVTSKEQLDAMRGATNRGVPDDIDAIMRKYGGN